MALYKTLVALAIDGDRIPRGSEIELSADQVAHFDPADLALVSSIDAPEEKETVAVPLEEMSHAQLKERAMELGLSASGSKADLQERIALHLAAPATEGDKPEGEEVVTEGDKPE